MDYGKISIKKSKLTIIESTSRETEILVNQIVNHMLPSFQERNFAIVLTRLTFSINLEVHHDHMTQHLDQSCDITSEWEILQLLLFAAS